MIRATFCWYPEMPIACEGDDVTAKTITLRVRNCPIRLQDAEQSLARRYGGYVQLWSTEHHEHDTHQY
jgi:hypothetical protein